MLEARQTCHGAGNRLSSDRFWIRLRCGDIQRGAHGDGDGSASRDEDESEGCMRSRSGAKRESRACCEYDQPGQDLS